MMEASKDAASSNSLLQRCNDLQNLCETVRTERNYSKRSFDLVSSSDALIPLTKRARSEATEILTTTITATTSSSSEEESALPVAMRPSLDREAFYKRLETFSAPFVSKRRPVNAVQCAMHGFVDTHVVGGPKQNICKLLCPSCQCTNFVIDISCFKTSVPKVQEIMQTYLADLSKLHRPGCFWKLDKCSDDIYAFPLRTSTEALDLISTEGARLLTCGDSLPTVEHPLTPDQLEKLDVVIRASEEYPDYYDTPALPDFKRIPYIIALFGWRLYLHGGVHSLKCHHCFRTMRLNQTRTPQTFNVLDHMEYCPWVNRAQAMVYKPSQQPQPFITANEDGEGENGEDGSRKKSQYVCGHEWMTAIIDLEYNFLFYMRETSIAYQESRLQWFKDAKRRMAKSRADLAMEFPDSPDYIPDKVVEVTENTDAPMDDRVEKENASVEGEGSVIAKDTVTATSPAEEATVEEETEVALDESNTLLAESQEKQKEPELVEQPESATVTPPTAAKEAEESETAHEIEDELIDYMESEPEDEDEAEPVAVSAVDAEATEKDGHLDEATATAAAADVEIDVSLLDDVQTSTAISTTVSTPVPDQLQQANEDDINAAITRQSPPSSEQEQDTDVFRSDLELNEKETMASHPGDEQQLEVQDQEQGSTADDVFTSSGVQIEEIDGLVEDMDGVEFVWPQDGEKVSSSDQEKEVGPISMEEDGQVASTVPVVGDQDSKVFERDAVDDNDVERVVEDADMAIESQQAIVDVNEPEPQQEEEEAEQETEQTPPVATEDSPEALVAGPAEQHQVGDDFVTKEGSDLPLTDNKENDEMQEIQGTVSVSSPKPEQDDDPSAKDNGDNDDVEALQKEPSPVVEGLDALDDDNTKQQPEQQQQQQNDDEATAAQVETTAVIDEQGEKDVIETTQQASNDDDGNESAIATQVNTARLGQANDKTLTETAMSADNEVARPEDNIQVEEIETVTEIEQAKVTTATATDDVQSESVVVTAGAEEEKGTTAASSPLVTEADVLGTPTEDASEEQQQSLTENIDTSVSTPQLLQSMEDALGQSPSHPVTEDTRVAEQVAETLASEEVTPVAATAAEVDAIHNGNTATTTTMLTFKDPEVDTMVEDEVDSSVAAGADENIEEGKDVEQVQGGSAGMVGTKGEKMEEDMVDRDGDVGMQEVVDEEMDNAEEEQEDGTMDEENAQPAAAAASENTQL